MCKLNTAIITLYGIWIYQVFLKTGIGLIKMLLIVKSPNYEPFLGLVILYNMEN